MYTDTIFSRAVLHSKIEGPCLGRPTVLPVKNQPSEALWSVCIVAGKPLGAVMNTTQLNSSNLFL